MQLCSMSLIRNSIASCGTSSLKSVRREKLKEVESKARLHNLPAGRALLQAFSMVAMIAKWLDQCYELGERHTNLAGEILLTYAQNSFLMIIAVSVSREISWRRKRRSLFNDDSPGLGIGRSNISRGPDIIQELNYIIMNICRPGLDHKCSILVGSGVFPYCMRQEQLKELMLQLPLLVPEIHWICNHAKTRSV